jgi:hypothetical protein
MSSSSNGSSSPCKSNVKGEIVGSRLTECVVVTILLKKQGRSFLWKCVWGVKRPQKVVYFLDGCMGENFGGDIFCSENCVGEILYGQSLSEGNYYSGLVLYV